MSKLKQYIGDSVYADYEHGRIKLTTENGYPDDPRNRIVLEPNVYDSLLDYVKWLQQKQQEARMSDHIADAKKKVGHTPIIDGEEDSVMSETTKPENEYRIGNGTSDKHPTPFYSDESGLFLKGLDGTTVATVRKKEDMEFIVRAVNSHEALLQERDNLDLQVEKLQKSHAALLELVKEAARDGVVYATFFERAQAAIAQAEMKP